MNATQANVGGARPTIAVVIAAYNCAPFIEDALMSIGAQTRLPDRVVVVDDGSTDTTASVVEAFTVGAPFSLTLLRQENRGIAGARNAGVAACAERLVAFLDGDDTYYPGFLARAAEALIAHPELVLCFLDRDVVDAQGAFIRHDLDNATFRAIGSERLPDGVSRLTGDPFLALMQGNVIPIGLMVRREAFAAVGGFDEDMRLVEDKLFLMCLARHGRFGFIDEPLGTWRRHSTNASGPGNAFWMAYYDDLALDKIERVAPRLQLTDPEIRAIRRQRKRNAHAILYAASVAGRPEFTRLALAMLQEGRAPVLALAKAIARYLWRRVPALRWKGIRR